MPIYKRVSHLILIASLSFTSVSSFAASIVDDDIDNARPGIGAMIGDALIARPLLLATTALGTTVFVASLPFTIMGGKVKEAAETLVIKPADVTFRRCLGCNVIQDKYKNDPLAQDSQSSE